MTDKPANVLSIVRDDVDHTKTFRLCQPTYTVMGVPSEPKSDIETAAGIVYATTTCKVVLECAKPNAVMSADEARKLSRALLDAVILAEKHDKRRRGMFLRKITVDKDDGSSTVTYGDETMALRKQWYIKPSRPGGYNICDECRAKISTESWVSERVTDKGWGPKKRVGEIRICLECYPKLIVDNAPIVLVGKP